MRFVVEFRQGKSPITRLYPHAVLAQDNWDDFAYEADFYTRSTNTFTWHHEPGGRAGAR